MSEKVKCARCGRTVEHVISLHVIGRKETPGLCPDCLCAAYARVEKLTSDRDEDRAK